MIASSSKESGAWLSTLPISSLGLRMDDKVIRIGVGLRLGVPLCEPLDCPFCGGQVDEYGIHGLKCRYSKGRHSRHSAINDIIKRSLESIKVPCHLEPTGITRSDGKRPDGCTLVPWKQGKPLVWDATCPDTLAPSHVNLASRGAGLVANESEKLKKAK